MGRVGHLQGLGGFCFCCFMEGGIQLAVGSRIVGSKGSGAGFANVCAKNVAAMKLHRFSPLLKSRNSVEDIIAARSRSFASKVEMANIYVLRNAANSSLRADRQARCRSIARR